MGKTIINGIEYSGSGASNASQLPYDNTMNTKEKIDENAAAISELNSNIEKLSEEITKTYTIPVSDVTIEAYKTSAIQLSSQDYAIDGYTIINGYANMNYSTDKANHVILTNVMVGYESSKILIDLFNMHVNSAAVGGTLELTLVYSKNNS